MNQPVAVNKNNQKKIYRHLKTEIFKKYFYIIIKKKSCVAQNSESLFFRMLGFAFHFQADLYIVRNRIDTFLFLSSSERFLHLKS